MPECPYAEGVSMTCSCGQCHLPATDALREYNDRLRYDLEQRDAEIRRLRDELDIAQDSLANRRVRELREALQSLRAAWDEHMKTCTQHVKVPSLEEIEAWRDAPSNTASAGKAVALPDSIWYFEDGSERKR